MGNPDYTYSASSRIPTRPLSYENASLALPRELIIDYTNAKIYICNLSGNIVDITQKILNQAKQIVSDTVNSDDTSGIVKNINIELEDGSTVSIESGIIQLFSQISNANSNIDNISDDIEEIKQSIPKASTQIPQANSDDGSVGTATGLYALADHVHPKGAATVADSANSVEWSNIKNVPSDIVIGEHNHDSVYFKKSGGDISGDVTLSNDKRLCGYTTENAKAMIAYIDSENRIHIGCNNEYPILLDSKLIISSQNYGESDPSTEGAVTGQVYFQLI